MAVKLSLKERVALKRAEEERLRAPAPVSPEDEDENAVKFSDDDRENVKLIRAMSLMTRLAAYYYREKGEILPLALKSPSDITGSDMATIFSFFATLGVARWPHELLGALSTSDFEAIKRLPPHVLKAGIISDKIVAVETFTDYSLAAHLSDLQGVVLAEGNIGETLLTVPRWNKIIRLSNRGTTVGRVLSGALEYLTWREATQNKGFKYAEVDPKIRAIARYVASKYSPEIREGKMVLVSRPQLVDKKIGLKLPKISVSLSNVETILCDLLKEAYDDKTCVPPSLSLRSDPVDYFSWLLTYYTGQMNDEDKSVLSDLYDKICDHATKCIDIVASYGATITPESIAEETASLPNLQYPLTHGAIFKHVNDHRATIRSCPIDVPRKSDSSALGATCGTASSVAWKSREALNKLDLSPEPGERRVRIDAYGTKTNWWAGEINALECDVVWHDIDYANKVDGTFVVRDILELKAGEGKGKYLLDDTMPKDFGRKLLAIKRAGYKGFITKQYLGHGSDGGTPLGEGIAFEITELGKDYKLTWSPGGAVHSPEYFLVGNFGTTTKSEFIDIQDQYIYHVVDMLKSNLIRSANVWAGCIVIPQWAPPPMVSTCKRLHLGGKVGLKAPTIDIPHTPLPAKASLVSRLKSGQRKESPTLASADPQVKSDLNGTHGEETNEDDHSMEWLPPTLLRAMDAGLEKAQDDPQVPRRYPGPLDYDGYYRPGYGQGKGAKFQGFREITNHRSIKWSVAKIGGGRTLYAFRKTDCDKFLCVSLVVIMPQAERFKGEKGYRKSKLLGKLIGCVLPEVYAIHERNKLYQLDGVDYIPQPDANSGEFVLVKEESNN